MGLQGIMQCAPCGSMGLDVVGWVSIDRLPFMETTVGLESRLRYATLCSRRGQ